MGYKGKNWKGRRVEDCKDGRVLDGRVEGNKLDPTSILPPLPFFLSSLSFIQSFGFGLVGVKVKTRSR